MHVINQPHRQSDAGRHQSIIHLSPDYLSPHLRGHRRTTSLESRKSILSTLTEMNDNEDGGSEDSMSLLEKPDTRKEFIDSTDLPDGHNCEAEECRRVIINVSGMKFETQLRTLNRLPNTLLGDKSKREQFWDEKRKEYFFDRHRPSFQAILYFYQSGGRLRRPIEVPTDVFLSELQFFELGVNAIIAFQEAEGFIVDKQNVQTEDLPKNPFKRKVWELFEYPESTIASKIIAILSVLFITISVVTFCVETLPEFKDSGCIKINVTNRNLTTLEVRDVPNFSHPLFILEATCIAWFILELVCRFLSCPSKIAFAKNFINWIDVISITPFIISIAMYLITKECEGSSKTGAISVLRVLRVARILKLSKHSEGLQLLGKTMKTSVKELMMFALFLGIGVVIFSGAIFYAELEQEGTHFHSIPGSFWWAVVTMTTVGYGDMYPIGVFGKVIGTLAVLCGLLSVAFPVPVIVTNFSNYYRASTGRGSWS